MNKNIKLLIEGIFDDNLFKNDIESEIDLTQTIYKYHPKTKEELKTIIQEKIKAEGNECDLNDIDVSNITDMRYLFSTFNNFNGNISMWNVSKVTSMESMFETSVFTGDISLWDVSEVTNMGWMFLKSLFNSDISLWNVVKVTNMKSMFNESIFDGDISQWNVSNVTDMSWMFYKSEFKHDISNWNINTDCDTDETFKVCHIKNEYKPKGI